MPHKLQSVLLLEYLDKETVTSRQPSGSRWRLLCMVASSPASAPAAPSGQLSRPSTQYLHSVSPHLYFFPCVSVWIKMNQVFSQHCASLLSDLRNCLRGTVARLFKFYHTKKLIIFSFFFRKSFSVGPSRVLRQTGCS